MIPIFTAFKLGYGHSPGLPPQEAPVMIAEKRKLFPRFLSQLSSA